MELFSTAGLPARRKMSYWSEVSSETFSTMQIIASDRERFEGQLCREVVGPLALAEVCSSAGSVNHSDAHVARAASHRHVLVIPISGGFEVLHGRQQPAFELKTGEFCLLDESRPYRLTHNRTARTFCVVFDDRFLREFIPDPARLGGVPVHPTHSMSRVLVSLLQGLSRELESNQLSALTPAFADSLARFIAAAYSELTGVVEASVLECRKQCIKQHINERLHDPQLRASSIAQHFGISERYLRLIFESDGEPLWAYVTRRRVENSAQQLRDASWGGRTITDIALQNGFNNVSHFGYAFKKRFGTTPRDYRRT
jgi:AraC family transcriptional regulator, positive regulator of tynA and feaB